MARDSAAAGGRNGISREASVYRADLVEAKRKEAKIPASVLLRPGRAERAPFTPAGLWKSPWRAVSCLSTTLPRLGICHGTRVDGLPPCPGMAASGRIKGIVARFPAKWPGPAFHGGIQIELSPSRRRYGRSSGHNSLIVSFRPKIKTSICNNSAPTAETIISRTPTTICSLEVELLPHQSRPCP